MGVSRKLVTLIHSSLSAEKNNELYQRILGAGNRFLWTIFPRGARTMLDIAHFKATEHRVFLLYLGLVVFKDLEDPALFQKCFALSIHVIFSVTL